jgi:PAS domain S-box-containing protein
MSMDAVVGALPATINPLLALHRSESSFHEMLDRLPAAAYTCDAAGLITYYNHIAVEIWGREPRLYDPSDRFCGSFKLYTANGDPLAHDRCWMALALQHRRPFNGFEVVIEQPTGSRRTALALANPILDESGTLLGALNVLVDISDRKAAEDLLRQADRSKNEFLATLAHELRNPLAPIRNALYLLQHLCPAGEEMQAALAIIDRQSRHMARLVDELLDVSRITSRKLDLRCERVDVSEVINTAVETSRPLFDSAGQRLLVSTPSSPVWISADPSRLAQALSNLLNNASKYSDRGGHVWLNVDATGGEAVITVADNGIGIAPEMLPRIFELFTQAVDAARADGGLGIGLALARHIVELHDGTLGVESDGVGKGSRFIVRVPIIA